MIRESWTGRGELGGLKQVVSPSVIEMHSFFFSFLSLLFFSSLVFFSKLCKVIALMTLLLKELKTEPKWKRWKQVRRERMSSRFWSERGKSKHTHVRGNGMSKWNWISSSGVHWQIRRMGEQVRESIWPGYKVRFRSWLSNTKVNSVMIYSRMRRIYSSNALQLHIKIL